MKLSKNTFLYTAIIAAVLVIAYFSSGSSAKVNEVLPSQAAVETVEAAPITIIEPSAAPISDRAGASEIINTAPNAAAATPIPVSSPVPITVAPPVSPDTPPLSVDAASENAQPEIEVASLSTAEISPVESEPPSEAIPLETSASEAPEKIEPLSSPEKTPAPVEPQDSIVSDKEMTCFLSISCHTILQNMDVLNPEKIELVPESGVIFQRREVVFYEGESVFNVLQREMKKNKIHMEFVNTPIYNSAYIEGINNLYEFDCGNLSGWMYRVNGWFPNYGCSRYRLNPGDEIEWVYTCDLGRDVGDQYFSAGGQRQ